MKPICIALMGLALSAVPANARQAAPAQTPQASPLKTDKDKVSYGIGVEFGASLKSKGVEVDPDMLARGLKDIITGAKLLMPEEDLRQILTAFQEEMKLKQEAARTAQGLANKKEADAFFVANAKNPGVTTLPDGMQYKIVKAATGEKPTASDVVVQTHRASVYACIEQILAIIEPVVLREQKP